MNSGLNIIVCIKAVLKEAPEGPLVRSSETCVLNAYDIPALEAAFKLRESHGGSVAVITLGPETCEFVIREALAMGADRGYLVCDSALAGSDTLATSKALGAAVGRLAPFDLVLLGTRSSDSDTGHVGPQTAELLGLPLVTGVYGIEKKGKTLTVDRKADGFVERYELDMPSVLTVHPSSDRPGYLGLKDIEKAYGERQIIRWSLRDIGLAPEQVGQKGSPTKVLSLSRIKRERRCKFLEGTEEEQADKLVDLLVEWGMEW
ncbi:MAG: electron transfer flavoprotein subunit beta/FixA family protein [Deltaproteobacteria bacterium]|nr:electron transfer flavoprotein subunit beta/FixA family protein [Deltaproteobacteria bacterium]